MTDSTASYPVLHTFMPEFDRATAQLFKVGNNILRPGWSWNWLLDPEQHLKLNHSHHLFSVGNPAVHDNNNVVAVCVAGRMCTSMVRKIWPLLTFNPTFPASLSGYRYAVLNSQAVEIELINVAKGLNKDRLVRLIIATCLQWMSNPGLEDPNPPCTHVFVLVSSEALKGKGLCLLDHTLRNVFGFQTVSVTLTHTWLVMRMKDFFLRAVRPVCIINQHNEWWRGCCGCLTAPETAFASDSVLTWESTLGPHADRHSVLGSLMDSTKAIMGSSTNSISSTSTVCASGTLRMASSTPTATQQQQQPKRLAHSDDIEEVRKTYF
jgi:hypothetical protein